MTTTTYIHAGTRISGARLAVMTMAPVWLAEAPKPRVAPFGQSTSDNCTEVSARRHRHR